MAAGMMITRYDSSLGSFFGIQNGLGVRSIYVLGNDEQKARMLPGTISLKEVFAFALTEPDYGSDAGNLKTTATKVEGGYLLNGTKTWIGNADICTYCIVWAKNLADGNKIQAFVVEKGTKGYNAKNIQNKMS